MSKKKTEVSMDTKELKSVKLLYGGIKGVEISYSERDDSRDMNYQNLYKGVTFGAPATGDMINGFDGMKGHLLDICGYPMEGTDREMLMNNLELTGISYSMERGFVLSGKLGVLDGSKKISLNTPLIGSEEEYPGYGEIGVSIQKVFQETKEYISGRKRLNAVEMVEGINAKKAIEGFDVEEFKRMPYQDQLALAIEFAENAGCMVLKNEEMDGTGEKVVALEPIPKHSKVAVIPEKAKMVVVEDGDDFSIGKAAPIAEVSATNDDDDFGI